MDQWQPWFHRTGSWTTVISLLKSIKKGTHFRTTTRKCLELQNEVEEEESTPFGRGYLSEHQLLHRIFSLRALVEVQREVHR